MSVNVCRRWGNDEIYHRSEKLQEKTCLILHIRDTFICLLRGNVASDVQNVVAQKYVAEILISFLHTLRSISSAYDTRCTDNANIS